MPLQQTITERVSARADEMKALMRSAPSSFDQVVLTVIDELPRRASGAKDHRRILRKLIKAASQGSQDAAALLLLAPPKYMKERSSGLVAFWKSSPENEEAMIQEIAARYVEEFIAEQIAAGKSRLGRDPNTGELRVYPVRSAT